MKNISYTEDFIGQKRKEINNMLIDTNTHWLDEFNQDLKSLMLPEDVFEMPAIYFSN